MLSRMALESITMKTVCKLVTEVYNYQFLYTHYLTYSMKYLEEVEVVSAVCGSLICCSTSTVSS